MAAASLRYRPAAATAEESKSGYIVFDGSPQEFHHEAFRTNLKFDTPNEADMPRTMREVIENLRGDALSATIEIGTTELLAVWKR